MEKKRKKSEPKKFDLEKIRQAGKLAQVKVFQSYVQRIADGEQLSPMEYKNFLVLQRDLEGLDNGSNSQASRFIAGGEEVCEYLGISKRMLSYHVTKGNLKQEQDGSFAIGELQRWAKKYKRKIGGKKTHTLDDRQQRADLRFRVAKARREEILVAQMEGRLMTIEEVAEAWGKRFANMRSACLTLIDRLPPMVAGKSRKKISQILKEEIYYFLEQFSREGKYTPDDKSVSKTD